MRKSLLGFNLLAEHDSSDFDAICTSEPRSILLLQEHRNQLRRMVASCDYPIVRTFFHQANFDPGLSAQEWFDHAKDNLPLGDAVYIAQQKGRKLWVQGPNEWWPSDDEPIETQLQQLRIYGRFEAERAHLLAGMGARAVVGNFAVGVPVKASVAAFYEGFNAALADKGVIDYAVGLHEYGYLWPWVWLGPHQGESPFHKYTEFPLIPKPHENAFLIGRFQFLGIPANVPIFITECGLDQVTSETWNLPKQDGGEPYQGWRTCQGYWKKQHSNGKEKLFYCKLLAWIDNYYRQFEQVKVVDLFGVGPHHKSKNYPKGRYWDFDLAGPVLDYMLSYIEDEGEVEEPQPGGPVIIDPPTPEPSDGGLSQADLEMLEAVAANLDVAAAALKAASNAIRARIESAKEDSS